MQNTNFLPSSHVSEEHALTEPPSLSVPSFTPVLQGEADWIFWLYGLKKGT